MQAVADLADHAVCNRGGPDRPAGQRCASIRCAKLPRGARCRKNWKHIGRNLGPSGYVCLCPAVSHVPASDTTPPIAVNPQARGRS